MLDPQILTYIGGFIAIAALILEYREKAKYKRLYADSKGNFDTHVQTISNTLAEKNKALAAEYLAKKSAQESLETALNAASEASKKCLDLNEALANSRAANDEAASDIQDLNEEIQRLHGQLNSAVIENAHLKEALDKSAKVSVSNAKRVAKKSVKKKKRG